MLSTTPPKWFRVLSIVAIVWNLLGVIAFITGPVINADALAQLKPAEQQLYNSMPFWAVIAFAVAVFTGTFGSVALLLKHSMAKILLMTSLVAVLIQMFHAYFISNSWQVFGPGGTIMPIMVICFATYLVILAKKAERSGWI